MSESTAAVNNKIASGNKTTPCFTHVKKRNSRVIPFSKKRIEDAIFKAAKAVGGEDRLLAEELSNVVSLYLKKNFIDKNPSIEEIQDIVEKVLIEQKKAEDR